MPETSPAAPRRRVGFHHVAIRSRDFDRSVAFYRDVLGFVETVRWMTGERRAAMLDAGEGNYMEIFERPEQPAFPRPEDHTAAEPTLLHVALRVDDVDATLARVRAAGMAVRMEPRAVTLQNQVEGESRELPIRIAFFYGPDDEVVELLQNELT